MTLKKTLLIVALAITAAAGGTIAVAHAQGQPKAASKGHDHQAPAGGALATEQLKLNAGQKWQTDETLRAGMTGIRTEIEGAIKPVHAGKFTPADYSALASRLEERVTQVVAKCKLPPDADAQLHLVVADLLAGASEMKGDGDRTAGVVRSIKALDAYGKFFDQPGWTKIAH